MNLSVYDSFFDDFPLEISILTRQPRKQTRIDSITRQWLTETFVRMQISEMTGLEYRIKIKVLHSPFELRKNHVLKRIFLVRYSVLINERRMINECLQSPECRQIKFLIIDIVILLSC